MGELIEYETPQRRPMKRLGCFTLALIFVATIALTIVAARLWITPPSPRPANGPGLYTPPAVK